MIKQKKSGENLDGATKKSESDSLATEFENMRKTSNGTFDKNSGIKKNKNGDLDKAPNTEDVIKMDNVDELRRICNETPTYEAWKTGQVPSPLKRGQSCKSPSPPPRPERVIKSISTPTTSRESKLADSASGSYRIYFFLNDFPKFILYGICKKSL